MSYLKAGGRWKVEGENREGINFGFRIWDLEIKETEKRKSEKTLRSRRLGGKDGFNRRGAEGAEGGPDGAGPYRRFVKVKVKVKVNVKENSKEEFGRRKRTED